MMTTQALERAARALALSYYTDDYEPETAKIYADENWTEWVPQARAVLMAVRDADGRALRKKVRETQSWLTAREGFTAMIDAILNDGEGG